MFAASLVTSHAQCTVRSTGLKIHTDASVVSLKGLHNFRCAILCCRKKVTKQSFLEQNPRGIVCKIVGLILIASKTKSRHHLHFQQFCLSAQRNGKYVFQGATRRRHFFGEREPPHDFQVLSFLQHPPTAPRSKPRHTAAPSNEALPTWLRTQGNTVVVKQKQ